MSNKDYVSQEVDKIYNDKSFKFPLNLAMSSTWVLGNLKGENLKVFDVSKTSSLSDYYILASATSSTQAQSMAETVLRQARRLGHRSISQEGMEADSEWILLDLGDIIVHIFLDIARMNYDLDNLWREAPSVKIPQEYYFSNEGDDKESNDDSNDKSFF